MRRFSAPGVIALAALLWCAALVCPFPADADYIEPGQVAVITTDYRSRPIQEQLGTYLYNIRWQGIPVGTGSIEIREKWINGERCFDVIATAKTNGAIDLLYKLRHTSESVFRADPLSPVEFVSDQVANSKLTIRKVTFSKDGKVIAIRKSDTNEEQSSFQTSNLILDPISAAFLAKSMSAAVGSQSSFDVFNGKHRYLVGLEVAGKERVRVGRDKVDAYRINPTVKKLTDTEGEQRLRSASLWVATDGSNEILKIESRVVVGRITAELESFVPAAKGPTPEVPPTRHAKLEKPLS